MRIKKEQIPDILSKNNEKKIKIKLSNSTV
jgi:hypothetical protein